MKFKFELIYVVKGILIVFILTGLGSLFALYRLKIYFIGPWIAMILLTLFVTWLYIVLFTDNTSLLPEHKEDNAKHRITYNKEGFEVILPLLDIKKTILWSNIETILYTDRIYSDYATASERFTIYLQHEPKISFVENPSWFNKFYNTAKRKNSMVLYLDDGRNRDLNILKAGIKEHLNPNIKFSDSRKGILIQEKIKADDDGTTLTQLWKQEELKFPSQVIYDVQHRSTQEILELHNMWSSSETTND